MSSLAQEQDVLDVVLHDRTGLIGLAVEAGAVSLGLGDAVRDLVPEDRRQHVEAEAAGPDLDVGVERHDQVPSEPAARHAYVTDDAADATTRRQDPGAFPPCLVELVEERLVVFDRAELARRRRIVLEGPVGRGSDDQMNRLVRGVGQIARISRPEGVGGSVEGGGPRYLAESFIRRAQYLQPLGGCCRAPAARYLLRTGSRRWTSVATPDALAWGLSSVWR